MFRVSIFVNSRKPYFQGTVKSAVLPGADGVFEVLTNHKPIMSALKEGVIVLDKKIMPFLVKRGVAMMNGQELVTIVEA